MSLLWKFITNNSELFPSHDFEQPDPILTEDGLEEYFLLTIFLTNIPRAMTNDSLFAGKVMTSLMTNGCLEPNSRTTSCWMSGNLKDILLVGKGMTFFHWVLTPLLVDVASVFF
ncbi:uncharacterized protein ARMOST_12677 [Armillaria ostoyae]|uniref:Uncharacterized protein n=1 Tax=Armillaria ostoyae TaxID=47428 RepID=A0A284RKL5_ARMOS|nr:uncharacterized protein ARMOST_12677 [Armillaria ostoyae]